MYVVVTAELCDDDAYPMAFVHGAYEEKDRAVDMLRRVVKGFGFDPNGWRTDDKYASCGKNEDGTVYWSSFDSNGDRTFQFHGRVVEV